MKSLTIKKAIVLTACVFMIPLASFAATVTTTPLHKDVSINACTGKKVGDAVTLHKNGKKIQETCQEVNGVLKAVVKMK